ncbi:hypothetical protein [Microbacterium marinilacus]|uniref:MFS transporter n=1 Tax=Microbacterium marinilacus TaxID=415209 RepID=A0ABP7BR13_9MICO|nr:hypothetical protein [Microbacterium marinilacus]MBY0689215.1 hypothetical protein [Microbacterium marinilacus]
MTTTRQRRALRGAVTASVATLVALMSHLMGGGAVPGWLGLLLPWLLSLPVGMLLAGRRLSLWRLSTSVAASQALFHVLFVLGTPSDAALVLAPHGGHSATAGTIVSAVEPHAATMLHGDLSMWLWHGLAAVLTVAWLHRAERVAAGLRVAATRVAAWVRRRFDAPVLPLPLRAAPLTAAPGWSSWHLVSEAQLAPLSRRGPPLLHTV